jgi:hypothetical protein
MQSLVPTIIFGNSSSEFFSELHPALVAKLPEHKKERKSQKDKRFLSNLGMPGMMSTLGGSAHTKGTKSPVKRRKRLKINLYQM